MYLPPLFLPVNLAEMYRATEEGHWEFIWVVPADTLKGEKDAMGGLLGRKSLDHSTPGKSIPYNSFSMIPIRNLAGPLLFICTIEISPVRQNVVREEKKS